MKNIKGGPTPSATFVANKILGFCCYTHHSTFAACYFSPLGMAFFEKTGSNTVITIFKKESCIPYETKSEVTEMRGNRNIFCLNSHAIILFGEKSRPLRFSIQAYL